MKAERERSKTQMKDLELQLSEMHDELDRAKRAELINRDKDALLKVKRGPTHPQQRRRIGQRRCTVSVSGCGAAAR